MVVWRMRHISLKEILRSLRGVNIILSHLVFALLLALIIVKASVSLYSGAAAIRGDPL